MEQRTQYTLEFDKVKEHLAQFASSALGHTHIEELTPSIDIHQIEVWLSEVSEMKEIRALHGHLPFFGLFDIREFLAQSRVQGAILAPLELRQIYDTLVVGRAIKTKMATIDPPAYQYIRAKADRIELVQEIEAAITRSLDEEGEVLDSASPKLKQIRKDLRQARDKIQNWLQNFLQRSTNQSFLQDQVITLRQNRYVIPVKAASKGQIKGIVHDQSSSGVTVFIEPLETVELNNHIASLEVEEKQEIQRILLELTDLVRAHLDTIWRTLFILGELDFINAKARLSEQWNGTQPTLSEHRNMNLIQARHPLLLIQQDHDASRVIPIDVRMTQEFTTILVTGPNTGGKTVSLKTIGLLTLMVQAGIHIPAAKDSETTVFTKIYADIGDQQSIEQSLSTFSSHVSHIVEILRDVDERSLVLLDELGAGTDPAEGASLGVALLEYLDRVNATCIATTHHDALKSYAYTNPRTMNACVEFDVNTLSPTYRLLFGLPGKSNAFIIAERLGLDAHIIRRAQELMGEDLLKVDHLIQKLTTDSEDVEKKKTAIDAKYRGVLRLEKETDKLMALAEQERQEIVAKALEEAKQIVDAALKHSQQVLQTLPASNREDAKQQVKTLHKEAASVHQKLKTMKKPTRRQEPRKPVGKIEQGGKVRLSGLNQTGTIISLSKDGKQAEIQVGSMRVDMPVAQLTPISSAQSGSKRPNVSVSDQSVSHDNFTQIELVIIGKRVVEAMDEVERYLDQAFMAGMSSVAIVHGIGTGKLKQAVSKLLQSHPHVVKHAIDERNYGMTNVELARK